MLPAGRNPQQLKIFDFSSLDGGPSLPSGGRNPKKMKVLDLLSFHRRFLVRFGVPLGRRFGAPWVVGAFSVFSFRVIICVKSGKLCDLNPTERVSNPRGSPEVFGASPGGGAATKCDFELDSDEN